MVQGSPSRNRTFGDFFGVQIVGTDPRYTICVWELWKDDQQHGYLYTQPHGGWIARRMSNGVTSGTSFKGRTWQQAIAKFSNAKILQTARIG